MFTLSEVECLGACVNAPMFQINDNYYVGYFIMFICFVIKYSASYIIFFHLNYDVNLILIFPFLNSMVDANIYI